MSKTRHVHGLPTIVPLENQVCECCLSGRQHRERFPRKSENRSNLPGQKIHSNLMVPMQHTSLGGSRYALVFTDDFSRKSWVFFLKHKSETIIKFLSFKKQLENEIGRSIQVLRTDRGGEYMSNEFMSYCKTNGIKRELTQANTPQQNGVSERRNRTIMERARSISHDSRLPAFLWTEAVAHANFLVNRSPT